MRAVGIRELKARLSRYLDDVRRGEVVIVTDRGKVLSARTTGVCTYHQRDLGLAIKRARNIALLPFTMF